MSITKETRVTLRKELVNKNGFQMTLTRNIVGEADEMAIYGRGVGEIEIDTQDVPALIAGLQELLGAE